MEQVKEFYLDVLNSKDKAHSLDNFVEVVIGLEHDSFDHEFGVERIKKPYIESVSLNGVPLDGAQKRLIVELLGGEKGLLS